MSRSCTGPKRSSRNVRWEPPISSPPIPRWCTSDADRRAPRAARWRTGPARRGELGVLHAARRSPRRPHLHRRPRDGHRCRARDDRVRPRPPVQREETGKGGWAETSLYDGMLSTLGCMIGRSERAPVRGRVVLGARLHVPELPVPLRRRRAHPGVVRGQGDVPEVARGARRRAERGGLLQRPGQGAACRSAPSAGVSSSHGSRATCGSSASVRSACRANRCSCRAKHSRTHTSTRSAWPSRGFDGQHVDKVVGAPIEVARLVGDTQVVGAEDPSGEESKQQDLAVAASPGSHARGRGFARGPASARLLRVRGGAARGAGAGRPGGRGDQGRAARGRGDEGRRVRAGRVPAREAKRGARSQRARVASGRRADDQVGRRRVAQLPRRGVDPPRHRRGDRRASQPARGLLPTRAGSAPTVRARRSRATTRSCRRSPASSARSAARATTRSRRRGSRSTMSGGWVTALGILAACSRAPRTGTATRSRPACSARGCSCRAAVFERDGALVPGPQLDGAQTGYGPGYRIYRCADGEWLALVLPDLESWSTCGRWSLQPPSRRRTPRVRGWRARRRSAQRRGRARASVRVGARSHVGPRLRELDVPVEAIHATSRDEFRRGILDDAVNRQLGRVASYDTADWGFFEQIGAPPPVRPGTLRRPTAAPARRRRAHHGGAAGARRPGGRGHCPARGEAVRQQ